MKIILTIISIALLYYSSWQIADKLNYTKYMLVCSSLVMCGMIIGFLCFN